MEKAQDWWSKAKGAISVGQKYADINIYAVEGVVVVHLMFGRWRRIAAPQKKRPA
jgi:hypothetical protein